jgi:hypothetical protein
MDKERDGRSGWVGGIGPVALWAGVGMIFGAAFGVPAVGLVLGAAVAVVGRSRSGARRPPPSDTGADRED